jgi:hypothetical protein
VRSSAAGGRIAAEGSERDRSAAQSLRPNFALPRAKPWRRIRIIIPASRAVIVLVDRRSPPGTGLTLAVLLHCWDKRTFARTSATTPFDPLRTFANGIAAGNAPRPTWPSGSLVGKTAQSGKPRLHQLSEVRSSLSYCLQRTGPAWSPGLVCDDELVSLPFA